jgi:hypothetical protein
MCRQPKDRGMAGSHAQSLCKLPELSRHSPGVILLLALLFAGNSSLGTLVYVLEQIPSGASFWIIDFPSFYMAADGVFNHSLSPYVEATRSLYRETLGFWVFPFLYPPYALPALYPLSWLDYTSGAVALLSINAVAAGVLFYLIHQMFLAGLRSSVAYWSALFVLFVCSSVRETVFVGQVNLFAALALLMAWQLLRVGARPIAAGMLIGIAIVTKTYFVLLLLLFLPRFEWRPFLGAVIIVIAFALCTIVLLPASLWVDWLTEVAPSGRYGTTPFPEMPGLLAGNQSINSALIRVFGLGETAGFLCLIIAGALLAAVSIPLWRRRAEPATGYFDAAMPLMLVTIYLVAPLSWMHHLVFVMPALLSLWADVTDRRSIKGVALVGIAGIWISYPWPLPDLNDISPYLTLIPIPGLAMLWGLCLHHALRSRRVAPTSPSPIAALSAA